MDHVSMAAEVARLDAEWRRTDPYRRPMTADEYEVMRSWEANDFPDEQRTLTGIQTRHLLNAWFKRERAAT